MKAIKVLIVRTAGTNCDQETKVAFEILGAKVELMHVNDLVKSKEKLFNYQIIAFPGGFTYGDDIAAGKILANELKMKLRDELDRFLHKNRLMIGICNGFQVLVKMGVLPGNVPWKQEATLANNDSGRFDDRWVYLKQAASCKPQAANRCVWTREIDEVIYLPVAHGEGKFIPADDTLLRKLKADGQIVFQYCDREGGEPLYPDNPNGSIAHIAGICDRTGRIFGLMPHPERFLFRTQHPRWTRQKNSDVPDGLKIFRSALNFLKRA
ncbi:MAG: phosphoribosylformylglycinamidine synthase I [Candidatus Omnitrophica bacterium]|nr:phosphoribosylformylglycinamidine synthase I [Candidatus Omnitrophota bacterium]MBU4479014.1 phosphoribosylformylglycinamidine synthase I [Candidatus Omnitrophota bacterium]MCG2703809.1 phosphoribosylformylglycinamidine synthase I [Candidatus Omnitrophota bacterium]